MSHPVFSVYWTQHTYTRRQYMAIPCGSIFRRSGYPLPYYLFQLSAVLFLPVVHTTRFAFSQVAPISSLLTTLATTPTTKIDPPVHRTYQPCPTHDHQRVPYPNTRPHPPNSPNEPPSSPTTQTLNPGTPGSQPAFPSPTTTS